MRLTGCQLHAPVWDITAQSIGNQLTIASCLLLKTSQCRSRKRFLKLIVNFLYTLTGFDNNGKGMLIVYARVLTLFPPVDKQLSKSKIDQVRIFDDMSDQSASSGPCSRFSGR
jgi:hypothetical protein